MPATWSSRSRPIRSASSFCMIGESSTISTRVGIGLLEKVGRAAAGDLAQLLGVVALALDDGVVAQGLQALEQHASGMGEEVDLARLGAAEVLGEHADRLALQVAD